jgi:hypothetical protein
MTRAVSSLETKVAAVMAKVLATSVTGSMKEITKSGENAPRIAITKVVAD